MKFYCLLLILLVSGSLRAQNNEIVKIEFQSLSRISFEKISITENNLTTRKKENRNSQEVIESGNLPKNEWRTLTKITKTLNLNEIPHLSSPTGKRTYDGARHSMLTIHTKDRTYEHLFDDDNPHAKLKPLMEFILQMKQ